MTCISRLVGLVAFAAVAAASNTQPVEQEVASLDDIALPDVDTVLSEASQATTQLTDTAEKMQKAITKIQEEEQAKLNRERTSYSLRLAEQEETNQRLAATIPQARQEIEALEAQNAEIVAAANAMKETNEGLRATFVAIYPKFQAAQKFLDVAINASDVPKMGKELQVLDQPMPELSLDNFLKQLAKSDDATALLEVSGTQVSVRKQGVTLEMRRRAHEVAEDTATEIVAELSHHFTDVQKAQQESDNKLKATFLAEFEAAQIKTEQLNAEIKVLAEQKESILAKQKDLEKAKQALESVNQELVKRMEGVSKFAQKSKEYVQEKVKASREIMADTEAY